MLQFQRNLILPKSQFTIFTAPSLRQCRLITNNRMLLNCTGEFLPRWPLGYADRFRKPIGRVWPIRLKVWKSSHLLSSSLSDGSSRFGPVTMSGCGVSNYSTSAPVNVYNYRLGCAIRDCSLSSNVAFTRRHFSKASRAAGDNDKVTSGNGNDNLSSKYEKLWSRAKTLAAQSRKGGAKGGDNVVAHSDPVINGGKNVAEPAVSGNNQGSKPKQASKKVATPTPSKGASQAKKSNVDKPSKSKQASKNNSTKNTPEEMANGSASAKGQSKNRSKKSKGQVKSVEGSDVSVQRQRHNKKDIDKSSRASRANKSEKDNSVKTSPESLLEHKPLETGNTNPGQQKALKPMYPPTGKSVVVVESLTKAKVIQDYLGDQYEVLASHGHIRDLAARSGSVRTNDNFSMVWEVPAGSWTHLKNIEVALSRAENLILASDPDCEGEAIAWHVFEMLQQQEVLREDVTVARVVFHEITEASIKKALQAPREINVNLVHAYLGRRALDYLIGFNISPLFWKKLPGCRSAGRVQSAALSLISDREMEIDEFKPKEYWTVDVAFKLKELGSSIDPSCFSSRLTHFDSKKLNQFSICSHEEAMNIERKITSTHFRVVNSKTNQVKKNPPPPFTTSSLQQDAANKLHWSPDYTMKLAQKLYEGVQLSDGKAVGLITYIKTDGLHISEDAVKDIGHLVTERYGLNFAAESARDYFKKVKNAREALEAIRPTDIRRLPSMLMGILDEDSLRLYTLIWARTMACQMESLILDQVQLDVGDATNSITFRSSCTKVGFFGYEAVYKDKEVEAIRNKESDNQGRVEAFKVLSSLKPEDPVYINTVELNEHKTQPPSRYTEGSLVKKLEELGIGRPSTYASTLRVLQERNYVTMKSRELYPEFRGRMVSEFLSHHFSEISDYSFTAKMEAELDNVSAGKTEWKGLLSDYWTRFSSYCDQANNVPVHQVEKMLDKKFGDVIFSSPTDRECPSCTEGTLILKVSKHGDGYLIGCDQYPGCKYTANADDEETTYAVVIDEPRFIGLKPNSNEKIFVKKGPYGSYVQLGENKKGYTPKRASIPQTKDANNITLDDALELLSYPKTFGSHPADGQPIIIKISKNGFSIKYRRNIADIPKDLDPNDLTMEKILKLLSGHVTQVGRPKNSDRHKQPFDDLM